MADAHVDRNPGGDNPSSGNNADSNTEEEAIAEMERMMALLEQDPDELQPMANDGQERNIHQEGNGDAWNNENGDPQDVGNVDNAVAVDPNLPPIEQEPPTRYRIKVPYATLSVTVAFIHVVYILRTRKQVYLALLYLTSSKASYIILGNMALSLLVSFFYFTVQTFLNGLRLMESETIMDNIRWNVTETCFAFTMFRSELTVGTIGLFCSLILAKCLHWAVELRGAHLRMTEDVFYFPEDHPTNDGRSRDPSKEGWWRRFKGHFKFPPNVPRVRLSHWKYYALMNLLYLCDIGVLGYFASSLLEEGPSVHILFSFEVAILLISNMSSHSLYLLHVMDGVISILQRIVQTKRSDANIADSNEIEPDANVRLEERDSSPRSQPTVSKSTRIVNRITSFWTDHYATANFGVELMTLAAQFLFHIVLFVAVLTIYGLPINIIREVYMSYQRLRTRLSAFATYRRLTSNMNARFEIVTVQEELEKAGPTCIICRDHMELEGGHGDCVKLPICEHIFHKHCLREWLVQQQSCPTCRADITANEAKAKVLKAAAEREKKERQEQENQTEMIDDSTRDNSGEQEGNEESKESKHCVEHGIEQSEKQRKSHQFPTPQLCKVTEYSGAQVVVFIPDENGINSTETKRVISAGTLVICMESKLWLCKESIGRPRYKYFLKTQDGWINENNVESLVELSTKGK